MRRWLVRLYPRAWRRRYEVEFVALLEEQPLTLGVVLDVVRGALDARGMRLGAASRRANMVQGTAANERNAASKGERSMTKGTKSLQCSFCGKSKDHVQRLIAGPGVYICDECITLCNGILKESGQLHERPMTRESTTYRCSFCGKSKDHVQHLIAGPGGAYICDECIGLCNRILEDEGQMPPGPNTRQGKGRWRTRTRWLRALGSPIRLLRGRHRAWQQRPIG